MEPPPHGRLRGFRALPVDGGGPPEASTPADTTDPTAYPSSDPTTPTTGAVDVLVAGPAPRRWIWRRPVRTRGRSESGWRWAIAAASVLVVAIAVIAALAFRLGAGASTAADQPPTTPAPTPATTPTPLAVPDLYQRTAGSVVLITTSRGSLGSGVVVTDTGTVLTANHVVAGGGTVSVVFADGTRTTATVASADAAKDIATLKPAKLPEVVVPATLGGGVSVGTDVVAIGNPLGLRSSTTTGVVSGLDRQSKPKGARATLTGLIQFDAAVNPGSSGGPLLDTQGLVVGVVVAIADPGGDDAFAGIGFAVPIGSALGGGSGDGPGGGPQL